MDFSVPFNHARALELAPHFAPLHSRPEPHYTPHPGPTHIAVAGQTLSSAPPWSAPPAAAAPATNTSPQNCSQPNPARSLTNWPAPRPTRAVSRRQCRPAPIERTCAPDTCAVQPCACHRGGGKRRARSSAFSAIRLSEPPKTMPPRHAAPPHGAPAPAARRPAPPMGDRSPPRAPRNAAMPRTRPSPIHKVPSPIDAVPRRTLSLLPRPALPCVPARAGALEQRAYALKTGRGRERWHARWGQAGAERKARSGMRR